MLPRVKSMLVQQLLSQAVGKGMLRTAAATTSTLDAHDTESEHALHAQARARARPPEPDGADRRHDGRSRRVLGSQVLLKVEMLLN